MDPIECLGNLPTQINTKMTPELQGRHLTMRCRLEYSRGENPDGITS